MKVVMVALAFGLLFNQSPSDLQINPAPHEAQVLLKGKEVRWREPSSPVAGVRSPNKLQPISRPVRICRVDPVVMIYGCRTAKPADPDPDSPDITPGDILRATRTIGLPGLTVRTQPGTQTLVNIETIFYAQPQPFRRSVALLDHEVDLVATPTTYRWIHGDGTTSVTTRPGKPYPAMDVTHRYEEPADSVQPRVDVAYQVRYRVDGGAWQTLAQTLTAAGPTSRLAVKEAAPVLAAP